MNEKITWPELGWSEEVTSCWKRGPETDKAAILDRAVELVNSVPYEVTLRWLFYGLWQDGLFSDVKGTKRANAKRRAYEVFSSLMSRLRHSPDKFQERWPIELADDRRDPIHRTSGISSVAEWLEIASEQLECSVEKMVGQENYVMVAFEAEAMLSQFRHYTQPYEVSLWPFSGATSIPYKKRLANRITWVAKTFELPVIILYFGDYDPAGLTIPESAFRHVRKWCDVDFTAYRVGLNPEQIEKYKIDSDFEDGESGGTQKYQWEAVRDEAAKEIITGALDSLLCLDTINELKTEEAEITEKVRGALAEVEI